MRLTHQVAIVTGAGRGLGEQIARVYCREGARIILASELISEVESVAAHLKKKGFSAQAVLADVRNEESVRSPFEEARRPLCGPPTA